MWIFVTLLAVTVCGGAMAIDARRRARRDGDDAYDAAHRRLTEAGEIPGAPTVGTVYTSAAAVDTRITVIADDPSMTTVDVATAVEHVAPGVGSLASFAQVASDTREMRTGVERRRLEAVYDEAYAENVERTFNTAVTGWWSTVENAWTLIDAWVEKYHGEEHYANCVHCAEVHEVHSDEYAQIVADRVNTDTGAWPVLAAA